MAQQCKPYGSKSGLIRALGLGRSTYYYRPRSGQRGLKPTTESRLLNGASVENPQIITWIEELLAHPFVCYGYAKVAAWLRQEKGLLINKKKVYRLMKQASLLTGPQWRNPQPRVFVALRVMEAERPNQAFQFDIKMYPVAGWGLVPCLSVIDVFTRQLKAHLLQRSIRQHDVKALWEDLLQGIVGDQPLTIRVRSDNGSQFAAKVVRAFFSDQQIHQEFCHVATPEEDCFIESFHSLVERELVRRHDWQSLEELQTLMAEYVYFYNTDRRHGSLGSMSPDRFARQWSDLQSMPEIVLTQVEGLTQQNEL